MNGRGQQTRGVHIYPDELFALQRAYAGGLYARPGRSRLTLDELAQLTTGRRTVRVLFDHDLQLARLDELAGSVVVAALTDGGWEDLNEVEITARLYSWVRELPVSRIDAP